MHLEITESVLMERIDGSLETLGALRRLGVHLSVDDFGTGYSSLSYLKRLPVQTLKIDRSFTDGLGTDPHDTSIVRAISALSDELGLELLAEGVETEAQLLRARGARLPTGPGLLVVPTDAGLGGHALAHHPRALPLSPPPGRVSAGAARSGPSRRAACGSRSAG